MKTTDSGFFVIGGTLRHDAPSYIERQADHELLTSLLRGHFCYVLTARQMGKSSLMVRTARKLREQGVHVVALDLTAVGQNLTPEQWYDGLVVRLGRQLHLEEEVETFWRDHIRQSPVQRFFSVIRDLVLPRRAGSLVVFVDEIDTVRSLEFSADEFFAAVRECHNRRAEDSEFNRVTFCLLGVATPSDLITDTRLTPFNIGRRIELHDFTEAEAAPLARGLGTNVKTAKACLQRILYWTNGHPYLTQRLCHALTSRRGGAEPQAQVDQACANLFLSPRAREQDDNLLFIRDRLLRGQADTASVLTLYDQVYRRRKGVADDETNPLISVLRLSGIARAEHGMLHVRNRIYGAAFDRGWIRTHMPDAERRRQRAAFWLGVMRTAGVAAVVVAVVAWLVYVKSEARRTEEAYRQQLLPNLLAQSQAGRLLGLAGQRWKGLEAVQEAARIELSTAVRNEAIACLAMPDLRVGRTWSGYPAGSAGIAFDSSLERYVRSDPLGNLSVRRVATDEELFSLPGSGTPASRLWFSPKGAYLAAAWSQGGTLQLEVWDLRDRRRVVQSLHLQNENAFAFASDDRLAAVGAQGTNLWLVDLVNGSNKVLKEYKEKTPWLTVQFQPGSKVLAVGRGDSYSIELVSLATGEVSDSYRADTSARVMAWSSDGQLLAFAGSVRRLGVRNVVTGDEVELDGHTDDVTLIAFSHDGQLLATASPDRTVRLWDPRRGGQPLVTWMDALEVPQLEFSSDDGVLGANLVEDQVQLWEVASGRECEFLYDPQIRSLGGLDVHPQGRVAACACQNGVALWDLDEGTALSPVQCVAAREAAFNPATGKLVASDIQGIIDFSFRIESSEVEEHLQVGRGQYLGLHPEVLQFAFATDGQAVAAVWDDRVEVFHPESLEVLAERAFEGSELEAVALAPDSSWLAVADGRPGGVWVFTLPSFERQKILQATGRVSLARSPNGEFLAAGTEAACQLWRVGSWESLHPWERAKPASRPAVVTFSPDSRLLAYTHNDYDIELVGCDTNVPLARLEAPRRSVVRSIRFTPEGTRLICATQDDTLQVWDLTALRRGLADLGLDWSMPPLAPMPRGPVKPLRATVTPGLADRGLLDNEAVLEEMTAKLAKNPNDSVSLVVRAYRLRKLRRYEESLADYQKALGLEPLRTDHHAWALRDVAFIHLFGSKTLHDAARARQYAAKAVALEPENPDNHYRLGVACFRGGDDTNALVHLQRASERVEGKDHHLTAMIWLQQSLCYARLDQTNEARRLLTQAIRANEANPVAIEYRGEFYRLRQEATPWMGR